MHVRAALFCSQLHAWSYSLPSVLAPVLCSFLELIQRRSGSPRPGSVAVAQAAPC